MPPPGRSLAAPALRIALWALALALAALFLFAAGWATRDLLQVHEAAWEWRMSGYAEAKAREIVARLGGPERAARKLTRNLALPARLLPASWREDRSAAAEAVPALEGIAEGDPEEYVRAAAREALEKIRRKNEG